MNMGLLMKKTFCAVMAGLTLAACAKSSNELTTSYVSPMMYKDFSCEQIEMEMMQVNHRVHELAGSIDKNASGDKVAMGVGLVLFWPALFFIDGDTPQAQEYSRLRGEFEALEKAGVRKNCSLTEVKQEMAEFKAAEEAKKAEASEKAPPAYPTSKQKAL